MPETPPPPNKQILFWCKYASCRYLGNKIIIEFINAESFTFQFHLDLLFHRMYFLSVDTSDQGDQCHIHQSYKSNCLCRIGYINDPRSKPYSAKQVVKEKFEHDESCFFLPLRRLVAVVRHVYDIVSNEVFSNQAQISHWRRENQREGLCHQIQVVDFDIDTLKHRIDVS